MLLTVQQSYALLATHSVVAREKRVFLERCGERLIH